MQAHSISNWEAVAVICVSVVTMVSGFCAWIARQIRRSIDDLSEKLTAKLETKETVNKIDTRLRLLEQLVREHGK